MKGETIPDDALSDVTTRVALVSPPPGTEVAFDQLDLTLYVEDCGGVCPPEQAEPTIS